MSLMSIIGSKLVAAIEAELINHAPEIEAAILAELQVFAQKIMALVEKKS